MSLLSSTQGTPERVWSLIAGISANGGALDRSQAADLLNPSFSRDGKVVREKPEIVNQALGAATSLGAIIADQTKLQVSADCTAKDYVAFCDWVYERLISLDSREKDAVVLETYAWMAVLSDRNGAIGWFHDETADAFADAADKALPDNADDDGDRRINSTKLPAWRRWLVCLGLLVEIPLHRWPQPAADRRAASELKHLDLPQGTEIEADEFLKALSARMPYVDGGRMFMDAAKRIGHAPRPRQLSPLLSCTLRDLHDSGTLKLSLHGDAGGLVHLSTNATHKVQSFHAVVVNRRAVI